MADARVKIVSISEDAPYERETTTNNIGRFTFNDAPADLQLELTATKPGYTVRSLGTSVTAGSSTTVRFEKQRAIGLRPEAVSIEPGWDQKGVSPNAAFKLTFSTEMDKPSVERSFAVQLDRTTPLTLGVGAVLPVGGIFGGASTAIYDAGAFDIDWPSRREVIFRFRDQVRLPALGGNDQPDYRVILTYTGRGAGEIKSSSGRTARATAGSIDSGTGPFYINGSIRPYSRFQVAANDTSPRLTSMRLFNNRSGGSDEIELTFSERMALAPRYGEATDMLIAGGSGGNVSQAPAAHSGLDPREVASNYSIQVNGLGWQKVVGTATFSNDFARRVVVLRFDDDAAFKPGDTVEMSVGSSITDPFGQTVSSRTLTGRVE